MNSFSLGNIIEKHKGGMQAVTLGFMSYNIQYYVLCKRLYVDMKRFRSASLVSSRL